MTSVMPQLARMIMQQSISEDPGEDPGENAGENAGPTFEYFPFEHGVSKETQLEELCRQAQMTNEGLDGIRSIVATLPSMAEL